MFQHQNVWLPDGESHFPEWMDKHGEVVDGRGTYQIEKWRACIPFIKGWQMAVDVGAHVGLWTIRMAEMFQNVLAFEPVAEFRECFVKNAWMRGVKCLPYALGAIEGRVNMTIPPLNGGRDTGGTHVAMTAEAGTVELRTLDSFNIRHVDFIKIDCEGYEHNVILGGMETIRRCKPCIIVEQKPHKLGPNFGIQGTPAVDLLTGMGAKVRRVIAGDYILTWD